MSNSEIETIREKTRRFVLTDNYAPVENLIAPIVHKDAMYLRAVKYLQQAEKLRLQGKWDKSISKCKDAISSCPTASISAYFEMSLALANQGKLQEAINAAKSAIEYNEKAKAKQSMSTTYTNLAFIFKRLGKNNEAAKYMRRAVEAFHQDLAKNLDSFETVWQLCNILANTGNFDEAIDQLHESIGFMLNQNRKDDAAKLQKLLKTVELKKSRYNR